MSTPTGESWQAKVGGGESPVKGIYANETVSVKKMGPREIEVTYKRDGKLYSVSKISVCGRWEKNDGSRGQQANRKSFDVYRRKAIAKVECELRVE